MTVRDWIAGHRRIVCIFLLALAGLNGWISYTIYSEHPGMAVANAAMAGALLLGVLLTW